MLRWITTSAPFALVLSLPVLLDPARGGVADLAGARDPRACCVTDADEAPGGAATEAFERLKGLVGDWVKVDEEGNATDELVNTFRLTAGGSALLETCFPGTEMEMITLYHLSGDDLVLTHYCVAGNQPLMEWRASADADTIEFEHVDGVNVESESEGHMHSASFRFQSDDRFETTWKMIENGEVTYVAHETLERRG